MPEGRLAWYRDARHFQIAALGTLLAVNMTWLDFGATPVNSLAAFLGTIGTQILASRLAGARLDLRSPIITGLSLSLLLRADDAWLFTLAGVLAIGSKFLLRFEGKHLWNPAAFAIVVLLFGTTHVWISPGQWGAVAWFALLLICLAAPTLQRAQRVETALAFLLAHGALLIARAAWLGDPIAIPVHQMESGSLLLFAFFMITDPRTTPDRLSVRILYAVAIAGLGHFLAFFEQMRPALYVALFVLAPMVPILDRLWPAPRFAWTPPQPAAA
jgi:Na+-transporting NADH:ubiquinone oxidoreductase subunit NqrB